MVTDMPERGFVLIMSIGPVQSFIAEARRAQDLWVSSQILQFLSTEALRSVQNSCPDCQVVYPASGGSMPNRLVAILPPDVRCEDIAIAAHRAVINAWVQLAESASAVVAKLRGDVASRWSEIWRDQCGAWINDEDAPRSTWVEVFWAAASFTEGGYTGAFRKASDLLRARKNLREFDLVPAQPGEKCTLNGGLSALSDEPTSHRDKVRVFWKALQSQANRNYSAATIRPGERLCAINTVKRFGQELAYHDFSDFVGDRRFPSTSTIAVAPFKVALANAWNAALEETFREYRQNLEYLSHALNGATIQRVRDLGYPALDALKPAGGASERAQMLDYDGDFLRPEGLSDKALKEYLDLPGDLTQEHQEWFALVRGYFKDFMKSADELCDRRTDYYAVLNFDGDHIGETLNVIRDASAHSALSEALAEFAKEDAPNIVESGKIPDDVLEYCGTDAKSVVPGRLVYSGGDDVLAMVPACSALVIAEALRVAFARRMSQHGFDLHGSAGIAIAHCTQPLETVLGAARMAEAKLAKRKMRRNALAVTLVRRSGEVRSGMMKWEYNDANGKAQSAVALLEKVRGAFSADPKVSLSSSLAYDTLEMASVLDRPDLREELKGARTQEFLRLVKRRSPGGESDVVKERRQWYADLGKKLALWAELLGYEAREVFLEETSGWTMLGDWLVIARFLARSMYGE